MLLEPVLTLVHFPRNFMRKFMQQLRIKIKNALGCMNPNIEPGLRKSMALVSFGSLGKMSLL